MLKRIATAFWILAGLLQPMAEAEASVVWRVDFNGAAGDTLVTSNFTGWAVAAASRTQTFANVDGGAVSSNLTVIVKSSGTFSTFERAMQPGAATNLYRDGAQCTVSPVTLILSNLAAGSTYQVRLWYYDDDFSTGTTQTYADVTDGGSVALGALTNTPVASPGAGTTNLPAGLYDSRYCLASVLAAGAQGSLSIAMNPSAGNVKWNALEVMESAPPPASILYSSDRLSESLGNDGSMGNALQLTLSGDQFAGMDGDDFLVEGWAAVTNIPDGFSASLARVSESELLFSLLGQAVSHSAASSVSNVSLTLRDGAFVSGDAGSVEQAVRTNLVVEFRDAPSPVLSYDGTVFQEDVLNDGHIGNELVLTLSADTFAGTNSEDFVAAGWVSVVNTPSGLSASLIRQSESNLVFSLGGQALSHAAANSLSTLTLTLLDSAFTSGMATQVLGYARADLQVVFDDPPAAPVTNGFYLSWSSVPGVRYTVDWTSNLVDFVVVASNVPADLALTGLTAAPPSSAISPVIYRIRVE